MREAGNSNKRTYIYTPEEKWVYLPLRGWGNKNTQKNSVERFRFKFKFQLCHNVCDPERVGLQRYPHLLREGTGDLWSPLLLSREPNFPLSQQLKPSGETGMWVLVAYGYSGRKETTKPTTTSHMLPKCFYFSQLFWFWYFEDLVLFLGWCYQHVLLCFGEPHYCHITLLRRLNRKQTVVPVTRKGMTLDK